MSKEAIRILIVEDEPIIARNLQQMLAARNYKVTGIAYDPVNAHDLLAQDDTDLVLLDINLNGQFEGLEIAEVISTKYKLPFIFITSYADESTLERAKIYRPSGYIVKPFEEKEIYAAIEVAWYNYNKQNQENISIDIVNKNIGRPLTSKEYSILQDLIKGKMYQEIANEHFISINTVNTHVKNIYSKFNLHSRVEVMKFIYQLK